MTICICCNDSFAAYNFRLKLIKELINQRNTVYIICGFDEYTEKLINENITVINVNISKTGKSIMNDYSLYKEYKSIYKSLKPDIIINYTVKPHIYSTLAARKLKIKIINYVSGVGSQFLSKNFIFYLIVFLYKIIAGYVWGYVFLNNDDASLFLERKIIKNQKVFFQNSEGIDLNKFSYIENFVDEEINFIFVGRLIKEKGVMEYLLASKIIKDQYNNINFYICGDYYKKGNSTINPDIIKKYEDDGYIKYLGYRYDIHRVYENMHAIVLPSYREGMPISLIEGMGRGLVGIASNVAGCRDVIDDGINGFLFEVKNVNSMVKTLKKYIELSKENKMLLKEKARKKVEDNYDVIDITNEFINIIMMD